MDSKGIDISPDHDSKVLKEIITPGEGDESPCKGNKVFVHYTGKLLDGTKFDSSIDRGEMFEFTLGEGSVIKAWDIGVETMKKGEKCLLTCHPDYAYGKAGSPPKIPENATLVFEIELFKWEMEDISPDLDKGILRSVIKKGEGYATPNDGSNVEVHIIGKYNGKQFEERELKFELGEGCDHGVVEGLDIAIGKLKQGEKSRIILSSRYAFGADGKPELNIPPNVSVEYEVTLKSFEKEKETWNMSSEEKLEQAEIVKTKGTNYFKNNKFEAAVKQYKKIINYLAQDTDLEADKKEKRNVLIVAGYLNLAACYLKLEENDEVIKNCDKALEIEATNTKGLFRKGQALLATQDYEIAKISFEKVLEHDSSNKAAQKNILVCKERMRQQLEKEKKLYQTMFKKMAEDKDVDMESPKPETPENKENGTLGKTDDQKQAANETVEV